ncbi:hypothetical protein, partial [Streptomyces albidoflavus]|uniref:hypothetical protein n=1 Tax=Streptomyces albidoflavus TaxID=1886 RepID=UPI001C53A262
MCTHGHSLAPRAAKAKRNPARRPQDAARGRLGGGDLVEEGAQFGGGVAGAAGGVPVCFGGATREGVATCTHLDGAVLRAGAAGAGAACVSAPPWLQVA